MTPAGVGGPCDDAGVDCSRWLARQHRLRHAVERGELSAGTPQATTLVRGIDDGGCARSRRRGASLVQRGIFAGLSFLLTSDSAVLQVGRCDLGQGSGRWPLWRSGRARRCMWLAFVRQRQSRSRYGSGVPSAICRRRDGSRGERTLGHAAFALLRAEDLDPQRPRPGSCEGRRPRAPIGSGMVGVRFCRPGWSESCCSLSCGLWTGIG